MGAPHTYSVREDVTRCLLNNYNNSATSAAMAELCALLSVVCVCVPVRNFVRANV